MELAVPVVFPSTAFCDGAKDIDQPYRYMLIGGLLRRCGSVLDVGCGNGLLRGYVTGEYTGIDGFADAIEMCRDVWGETFICTDAAGWSTDQKFDAVVLNEVLYYIKDQPAFLAKYSKMVAPGGVMIVSIYDKPTRFWQAQHNRQALRNALDFAGEGLQCRIDINEHGKQRTLLVIGHCQ